MNKVTIEWSYDNHDCETCGWSASQGAKAWVNGECVFDQVAIAHCFGSTNVSQDEVYQAILNHLGYDFESYEIGNDDD